MSFEKYIGLKYKEKGRDFSGVDCYGLVRLIYKNEYKIDLPSFTEEYTQDDTLRIQELIAQYKEGWESVDDPVEGSIVLFRVLGTESHVGVVINSTQFIHVRENQDSVIESLDSAYWKKRKVGYFKYSEKKSAVLNAVPHPLRTERYTMPVPPGTNLKQLAEGLTKEYGIAEELKSKITVLVNGSVIPRNKWEETLLDEGDAVEYRAVPTGSAGRMLAMLAIAVVAPYVGTLALQGAATYAAGAGLTIGATAGAAIYYGAMAATYLIGGALVNAIAPIRPPISASGVDPGSAERQLMVNGGSNQQRPYSAIPVVLGKVRVTPPLGSTNYLTYENERDSYVSMLLVWGYGPLHIDLNTLKIGDSLLSAIINVDDPTKYKNITLDRKTEPTQEVKDAFDAIYGKDVTQVQTNKELTCDGNPEFKNVHVEGVYTYNTEENTSSVGIGFTDNQGFIAGQQVTTVFTIPSGLSGWVLNSQNVTNLVVSDLSSTVKQVTCTIQDVSGFSVSGVSLSKSGGDFPATFVSDAYGVTPGPWFEASTNETANTTTVALHFPQGLRKIKIKGDGSGESYSTSVQFRIEYSIDAGSNWNLLESFSIGGDAPKKDGFTFNKTYTNLPSNTGVIVRVRRETGDNTEDNPDYRFYHTVVLQNVTFLRNSNPCVDPVGAKIAKSAIKINATEELNGTIAGISAVVQTWCKSWNGVAWVDAATSNPADLFRYVLEHPANPRRVTNASTQINLTALQYFATYCNVNGFEYNSVMGESRSVLEVLRDICAAGRASPALIDGKWTVIIDEAKSNVVQHFTPHNSWGFEGNKALPKRPDGLKVNFYNEEKDYQEDEIIVYDINKNDTNSTLFESITLPGVTKKSLVIDHARWHMAQIKLRPEVYTLNSDIEYLVCNRGDRVKVMHDVPMWGLGSGRVRSRVSSTVIELDEELPMQQGSQYTIRFRSKSGNSVVRNIVPKTNDGYYTEVELTQSVTTDEVDYDDLFLFGQLQQESQDLIVLAIEPSGSKTARLTLVDYGVTPQYNIFTEYHNLTSGTVFESQLSLPPSLQIDSFGNKTPNITAFVSDESVMERISKGIYRYNINVSYVNAISLPSITEYVELQHDLITSTSSVNSKVLRVPYQKGSVSIVDVSDGETYKVRLRYLGKNGLVGPWSAYSNHTVVGKTNPPSDVTNFTVSSDKSSGQLLLTWNNNPEVDVFTYEVRATDAGWGFNDYNRIFYGDSNRCFTSYVNNSTFYVKAIDSSGNYSLNPTTVSYVSEPVKNVSYITYNYADTALTSATVTLNWNDVIDSEFDVASYEITYNGTTKIVKANTITVTADWVGDRLFTIKTIDVHGNKSTGYSQSVTKARPNPVTDARAQVIDNTVMLYWNLPQRTSLPIDHVLIKKGTDWNTAVSIGDKKGAFTTITEIVGAEYTYWLAAVDTDGIESDPVAITTLVNEPPDFTFNGEFFSSFAGSKISATYDGSVLALPVNTTETFQQHFTSRSWNTPQDQINAGYPIFIQPTNGSGYYEETFDFGVVLASSRIVLNYRGRIIAGSPVVTPKISLSLDNSTFVEYNGVTDVYGSNFRYVKIRISVTGSTNVDLYEIAEISVRSDSKLKNDAGNITASSSDSLGTIVNFNKEFIDVQSITVSPSGTTPIVPVYDLNDQILNGTYSVSSGVCTVTSNNHELITGQKVRLYFSSGSGVTGIYTITSYTANTFTVNMTTGNTSGNCTLYPQSFRLYLFNNSGSRVSAPASWAVKGY